MTSDASEHVAPDRAGASGARVQNQRKPNRRGRATLAGRGGALAAQRATASGSKRSSAPLARPSGCRPRSRAACLAVRTCTTSAGRGASPFRKAMQGKLPLASAASPVRKPSDCSASRSLAGRVRRGKALHQQRRVEGTRLSWQRLPDQPDEISEPDNAAGPTASPLLAPDRTSPGTNPSGVAAKILSAHLGESCARDLAHAFDQAAHCAARSASWYDGQEMAIKLYDLAAAEDDRRFSPYCWRVKMALLHKGLDFETIAVALHGEGSHRAVQVEHRAGARRRRASRCTTRGRSRCTSTRCIRRGRGSSRARRRARSPTSSTSGSSRRCTRC